MKKKELLVEVAKNWVGVEIKDLRILLLGIILSILLVGLLQAN